MGSVSVDIDSSEVRVRMSGGFKVPELAQRRDRPIMLLGPLFQKQKYAMGSVE